MTWGVLQHLTVNWKLKQIVNIRELGSLMNVCLWLTAYLVWLISKVSIHTDFSCAQSSSYFYDMGDPLGVIWPSEFLAFIEFPIKYNKGCAFHSKVPV